MAQYKALIFFVIACIPTLAMFFLFYRFLPYLRERKLERMRRMALKYIDLLHKTMITENYPRSKRRQFWREFVQAGRFNNE